MFARRGEGTLAPWDETQKLVVHGVYCHVRNPMISSVFCILAGEAALLGSLPILYWFLFFLIGNLIYIPLSEEPGLEHRFGDEYRRYKANVPRWIPRLTPWQPPASHEGQGQD
jgi:protein-S-isoprenylcysteine O-methyltransferase Ste14